MLVHRPRPFGQCKHWPAFLQRLISSSDIESGRKREVDLEFMWIVLPKSKQKEYQPTRKKNTLLIEKKHIWIWLLWPYILKAFCKNLTNPTFEVWHLYKNWDNLHRKDFGGLWEWNGIKPNFLVFFLSNQPESDFISSLTSFPLFYVIRIYGIIHT